MNRADDATKLKEELDEDLVLCVVLFQLSSSGAQLGSIGDVVTFGVAFFYFGFVVGP
mgnify:CR=1 FL=1